MWKRRERPWHPRDTTRADAAWTWRWGGAVPGRGVRASALLPSVMLAGFVLAGATGCTGRATSDAPEATAESTSGAPGGATGADAPGDAATPVNAGAGTEVPRPRVVFLGTSLTAGLGLPPEQAYPALLQARADSAGVRVQVVNAGLSGETSAGALRRAAWVLEQPAALVILEVGANDGLRGVDPDSTRANVIALVAAVREARPEARVALVQMEAPTNLGADYTARFHRAFVDAARLTKVPLLPFLLDGVAGEAGLNQADGIHPNEAGAQRVADTMWRALLPLLRDISPPAAAPLDR